MQIWEEIMSNINLLTTENFADETATGAYAIDFYADWCGPCKMMGPVFEEASSNYDGKVKFGKINIDEQRNLALEHQVMSIPTLLFIKDGKVMDRITGVVDATALKEKLDALL
jgi:thioredoxin 1